MANRHARIKYPPDPHPNVSMNMPRNAAIRPHPNLEPPQQPAALNYHYTPQHLDYTPTSQKPGNQKKPPPGYGWKKYYNDEDGAEFNSFLYHQQCESMTKTGRRCTRLTVVGLRHCFQHLGSDLHLKISESAINHAGKGVFALGPPNVPLFRQYDIICYYDGIPASLQQQLHVYGPTESNPYGLGTADDQAIMPANPQNPREVYRIHHFNETEDGSWHRGLGSMINHSAQPNASFMVVRMPWDVYADWVFSFGPIPPRRRYVIGIVSLRNIYGGEEITVNYGDDYGFEHQYHHVPR